MSVATRFLIADLRDRGVHLTPRGDRLGIQAPDGVLTESLRQELLARKADIMAALRVADMRAQLLAVADAEGIPAGVVVRMTDSDIEACFGLDADVLLSYVRAAQASAEREAGRVPPGDTATAWCRRCGPIWTHPTIADMAPAVGGMPVVLACPWCRLARAGKYVPRPTVTCVDCARFTRDTINPAGGAGACHRGSHYPNQRHHCRDFEPMNTEART